MVTASAEELSGRVNTKQRTYLQELSTLEQEANYTDALVVLREAMCDPDYAGIRRMLDSNLRRISETARLKARSRRMAAFAHTEFANNPYQYAEYKKKGGNAPLVSLTTISTRLDRVAETIATIQDQSLPPHSVNLYISEDPYLIDKGVSPNNEHLRKIGDLGANIYFVDNIGPYRKQIPLIHQLHKSGADDQTPFITIDDDVIYPDSIVKQLFDAAEESQAVISHRGRQITFSNGWFDNYKSFVPPQTAPSLLNIGTGRNGILYRLNHFPRNYDYFIGPTIAPTADDLWCKYITAGYCIPTVILEPNAMFDTNLDFKETRPDDKRGLFHNFNARGRNDLALTALEMVFSIFGRGILDLTDGKKHV